MNSNAKRWIRALRGGEYRQASGRLRQRTRLPWQCNTFCALGVLYDLYLRSGGKQWPESTHGRLPVGVLSWAGISRRLEETVIMHNDMRTSFRDIAGIIEAHFARLAYRQGLDEAERITKRAIEQAQHGSRYSGRQMKYAPNQQIGLVVEN